MTLKYRIKPQHLHSIYLLLKFAPENLSSDFSKYSQAVIDYYTELRPESNTLATFIRLWIYGSNLKNPRNIENEVIKALEKSNSKDGWFYLKRYLPSSIYVTEALNSTNT